MWGHYTGRDMEHGMWTESHSQSRAERECTYDLHSALSLYSPTVQDLLSREWCHSEWTGSLQINRGHQDNLWQPCPNLTKWRQSLMQTLFPNDSLGWIKVIPSQKSQISPLGSLIPQTRAIKHNVLRWKLGELRKEQLRRHTGPDIAEHLVLSHCGLQSWGHPDLL